MYGNRKSVSFSINIQRSDPLRLNDSDPYSYFSLDLDRLITGDQVPVYR